MENIFKEKFGQFEFEPSSDLFDKIQAKRTKSKRLAWVWSAAALLILVSGVAYFVNNRAQYAENEIISNTVESLSPAETEESSELHKEPILSDQSLNPTSESTETTRKESNQDLSSEKREVVNEGEQIENRNQIGTQQGNITEGQANKVVNEKLADLFGKQVKNKPQKLDGGTLYQRNKKSYVEQQPVILENSVSEELKINDNSALTENDVNSIEDEDNTKTIVQSNQSGVKPGVDSTSDDLVKALDQDNDSENSPLPTGKLVKYSKLNFAISAGPGITGRRLSGSEEYSSARNGSESQLLGYTIDLRGIYDLNPKWNIQFGINATERNETFEYKLPDYTVKEVRTEQRQEIVIHPVLGRIVREYSVDVVETKEIEGEVVSDDNTFLNIAIPIALERYLYRSNKFSLVSKVGIMGGIYSKASGTQLSANGELSELESSAYRSIGIHQAVWGVGALYHINQRVAITAYPQAQFTLNSSFSDQYLLQQRETGIFGHLGLRIRL